MILLTAATTWEASPLLRKWRLKPGRPGCFEGTLRGSPLVLVRTGVGGKRTAAALAGLPGPSENGRGPLVAVSSGLAGALQDGIRSGDIVADLRGAGADFAQAARETAGRLGLALHLGAFHTVDAAPAGPAAKRAAGERLRAVAVDMESSAVREWCQAQGGIFAGVRAVLDAVDDRLPDWPCEDESPALLARRALSRWSELPSLAALGWRARRAMGRLAIFLDAWLRELPFPNGLDTWTKR